LAAWVAVALAVVVGFEKNKLIELCFAGWTVIVFVVFGGISV